MAVFHATARPSAKRATVKCWQTIACSAQRPAQRAAGELRARLLGRAQVLAPHVLATRAPVAQHRHQQRCRSPAKRHLRERAHDAVTRRSLTTTPTTPRIGGGDTAGNYFPVGPDLLPDDPEAELMNR